jgi:hypothetical protein
MSARRCFFVWHPKGHTASPYPGFAELTEVVLIALLAGHARGKFAFFKAGQESQPQATAMPLHQTFQQPTGSWLRVLLAYEASDEGQCGPRTIPWPYLPSKISSLALPSPSVA